LTEEKDYQDRIRFDRVTWDEVEELRGVALRSLDAEALANFEARVGGLIVHSLGQVGLIDHGMEFAETERDVEKRKFPRMHYMVKLAALMELHARVRAETELQPVFTFSFPAARIEDALARIEGDDMGEYE
jgi:hypothetical protein